MWTALVCLGQTPPSCLLTVGHHCLLRPLRNVLIASESSSLNLFSSQGWISRVLRAKLRPQRVISVPGQSFHPFGSCLCYRQCAVKLLHWLSVWLQWWQRPVRNSGWTEARSPQAEWAEQQPAEDSGTVWGRQPAAHAGDHWAASKAGQVKDEQLHLLHSAAVLLREKARRSILLDYLHLIFSQIKLWDALESPASNSNYL